MNITPLLKAEPNDAVTYTHLKQAFDSKGFHKFIERLRKMLASDHAQLTLEKDNAELHRNQGRADRTEKILGLPAQMLAECKPVKQ